VSFVVLMSFLGLVKAVPFGRVTGGLTAVSIDFRIHNIYRLRLKVSDRILSIGKQVLVYLASIHLVSNSVVQNLCVCGCFILVLVTTVRRQIYTSSPTNDR
jgi:hypothetical protein